ncbi:MAG: hypothetical protein N3H84_00875 [Candidatus Caldarchaeum sp.]|nr:hypothetical protein [Candidatus Caldarchaeum sp.]MCX8200648.1 hypothetical protein [Candidatus Caldarchaeum sp.]MDW8435408.1 hypothetical protein [Candidatus Caldarchaeum sp.]
MKATKTEELIPLLRSMVANELVKTFGLKKAETARTLSVTPQAVTQYLKGVRALPKKGILAEPRIREMVREFAGKIAFRKKPMAETELLDLAYEVLVIAGRSGGGGRPTSEEAKAHALRILRNRMAAEHEAAEIFLSEAIKAKDDMVRLLFRQIASDSIRHADIVQATISAVEKDLSDGDLPDPERLHQLQQHEEKSHSQGFDEVKQLLRNNVVKILLESIEADEAKHDVIIGKLAELAVQKRSSS